MRELSCVDLLRLRVFAVALAGVVGVSFLYKWHLSLTALTLTVALLLLVACTG